MDNDSDSDTSVAAQFKERYKQFKERTPGLGIDLSCLRVRMTLEQWDAIEKQYKDASYSSAGYLGFTVTMFGGVPVQITAYEELTGLFVDNERIGSTFTCPTTAATQSVD